MSFRSVKKGLEQDPTPGPSCTAIATPPAKKASAGTISAMAMMMLSRRAAKICDAKPKIAIMMPKPPRKAEKFVIEGEPPICWPFIRLTDRASTMTEKSSCASLMMIVSIGPMLMLWWQRGSLSYELQVGSLYNYMWRMYMIANVDSLFSRCIFDGPGLGSFNSVS